VAVDGATAGLESFPRAAGRPLAILLGNDWHARSAQAVYDRYRARLPVTVWAHPAARGRAACAITDAVTPGAALPGAVCAYELGVPHASELASDLPEHRALTCADAVVGAGAALAAALDAPPWGEEELPS
jgi:ABC-type cobalamin transport system permease subunit